MVSSIYNVNGINKKMENLPKEYLEVIPDMELLKEFLASNPETMIVLLDAMDQRDIRDLLSENGFSKELQRQLVIIFTEKRVSTCLR